MWRGAGLGWMAPSNLSLAVHYLKAKPGTRSGPNLTIGGEWSHVHAAVSHARHVAFPSLLYHMAVGPVLDLRAPCIVPDSMRDSLNKRAR